jgi:hypothetical protein
LLRGLRSMWSHVCCGVGGSTMPITAAVSRCCVGTSPHVIGHSRTPRRVRLWYLLRAALRSRFKRRVLLANLGYPGPCSHPRSVGIRQRKNARSCADIHDRLSMFVVLRVSARLHCRQAVRSLECTGQALVLYQLALIPQANGSGTVASVAGQSLPLDGLLRFGESVSSPNQSLAAGVLERGVASTLS